MKVRAHRIDSSGHGVADFEGLQVHVEGLLCGEQAEVQIDHKSPHKPVAWAHIRQRVGPPSPDRAAPACPAFGQCGGCVLQQMTYPAQLAAKRGWIEAALGRPVAPVAPAPFALGYRNKGKYVASSEHGELVLGAYRPRSHVVVSTLGCKVVEPGIDAMACRVRDVLSTQSLQPWSEQTGQGDLRYVVIRSNGAGQLLVILVTRSQSPRALLERAAAELPAAHGVIWMRNDSTGGTVLSDDWTALAGSDSLQEWMSGVSVDVGPTAFTQVNRSQAERLYARVAEATGANAQTRALDLYCGLGGITFALAAKGAAVVGVERLAAAAAAAQKAADAAGLGDRVRFECASAHDLRWAGERPDIVVVNPPRRGLDAASLAAIDRLAPRALAYVSCEPRTLARDMQTLTAYEPDAIEPFDLMPGSLPVETLVVLRRLT